MLYFLLHNADSFHQQLTPALAASWRQGDLKPLAALAATLQPNIDAFIQRFRLTVDEAPLLRSLSPEQRFDKRLWRHLVGELLLYAAADAPTFQTVPETLTLLLTPDLVGATERTRFAPIQQVHFGSRNLNFGGANYRPQNAGWNDVADVARLAEYLPSVDTSAWTADDLLPLSSLANDEERDDELDFARDCLASLRDMYQQASERGQVIVCEDI